MNYFQKRNYLKSNKTKIEAVALEFWAQNPDIADTKEDAIEGFAQSFKDGNVGVKMIDMVYKSLLSGEKIFLKCGATLEEAMTPPPELMEAFNKLKENPEEK